MTDEWRKAANGNLLLEPLASFSAAVGAGAAVLLRLETVPDPAALRDGRRNATQIVMSPPQARELAAMLTRQAARAERSPPAGSA